MLQFQLIYCIYLLFVGKLRLISGIVTQGKPDTDDWITQYHVLYSLDGYKWLHYKEDDKEKVILLMFVLLSLLPIFSLKNGLKKLKSILGMQISKYFRQSIPPDPPRSSDLRPIQNSPDEVPTEEKYNRYFGCCSAFAQIVSI